MTALAANALSTKTKPRGRLSVIVTNAATIYTGAGVALTTAGRASPWADTAGMEWLGLSMGGTARNSSANAGGKVVGDTSASPPYEVDVDVSGRVLLGVPVSGASAQANIGDRVYSATDNLLTDLTLTPTTNVRAIGRIVRYISATSFDVQFFTPAEYANQALQGDISTLAGTLTGTTTGTMVDVAAAACAGGATPTAAQVDTAIDTLETSTNLALKELQTKLNALLTALNLGN